MRSAPCDIQDVILQVRQPVCVIQHTTVQCATSLWRSKIRTSNCTVDGQKSCPLVGPFKGISKETKGMFSNLYIKNGFKNQGFWLSPEVLEGLGSSGRLVGSISTYPGTCQCPWSRVMTKNPRGIFFVRARYYVLLSVLSYPNLLVFVESVHRINEARSLTPVSWRPAPSRESNIKSMCLR